MEPRDAQKLLLLMREKYKFTAEEDEVIMMSVGLMDSASFTKTRIKGIFAKRKKRFQGKE